jgi:sec-independent protein translocase protein TatA
MSVAMTPLQIPMPGGLELAVLLLIAVLLFGAQKIPKLARSTGQAMGEFKRGRQELEQELEELEQGVDESVNADTTGTSQSGAESTSDTASTNESTEDEA